MPVGLIKVTLVETGDEIYHPIEMEIADLPRIGDFVSFMEIDSRVLDVERFLGDYPPNYWGEYGRKNNIDMRWGINRKLRFIISLEEEDSGNWTVEDYHKQSGWDTDWSFVCNKQLPDIEDQNG